jgi:hypothetical protein
MFKNALDAAVRRAYIEIERVQNDQSGGRK